MTTAANKFSGKLPDLRASGTEPSDRLWTRDEFDRLVEDGFFTNERVELVEGRIVQMSPQRVPHSICIELVDGYLRKAFPKEHRIRTQLPFRSGDGSEPEPDFAVIEGSDPRSSKEHPSSAVLIIEISDTTLAHDRRKAILYAASGVAEYWILNLVGRSLEVYRQPAFGEAAATPYIETKVLEETQRIAPLGAMNHETAVADLLP